MAEATEQPLTQNVLVLDSREAILALSPLLEALALRCGQPGAMHWLPYFLDPGVLKQRLPRLVLLLAPEECHTSSLSVEDLRAAALFFEYEVFGLCTGVVATADAVGFNSIVAPAGERAEVAALASRALLERGASALLATYEDHGTSDIRAALPNLPGLRWATRTRRVPRMLPLEPTLDGTLARMGKSTRFNLRYYRRRLEKHVPCEFVADAGPLLQGADLQSINRNALNPVPQDEFDRRVRCASTLPDSLLCGLRDADGKWLSLIGGWRQDITTVLYWQMNSLGYEKHSIGTVMRSFFLESEINRGARTLLIYGGTPHSMRHAFTEDVIADLVIERVGPRARVIRGFAHMLMSTGLLGRNNFVLETLRHKGLNWQKTRNIPGAPNTLVIKPVRARRAVQAAPPERLPVAGLE